MEGDAELSREAPRNRGIQQHRDSRQNGAAGESSVALAEGLEFTSIPGSDEGTKAQGGEVTPQRSHRK